MGDSERENAQDDEETNERRQESENSHSDASSSDSEFDFEFTCETCNKTFSGLKPLRQHEKGAQHLKRVRKKKAEKSLIRKLAEEDPAENEEDDDLDQSVFAVCKTCKKDFMGPESLQQHLKSRAHQKKMAAVKLLKEIRDEDGHISLEKLKQKRKEKKSKKGISLVVGKTSENSSHSDSPEDASGNCGACGYSGPPKSSDDSSDDEIIAETQLFECMDCKKVFTGVNPYYQHLISKVHEKTLKQKELFDKLRIAGNINSGESSTDQYLVQEEDEVITCKLCNVALSGPESAAAHLKSKKHIKSLQLKKWKKAMNEKRRETKSSSKVKKMSYLEPSFGNNSEVSNKTDYSKPREGKKDHQEDLNQEFSFNHDVRHSVSELMSSPKVEKITNLKSSTAKNSEERSETYKSVTNHDKLQNRPETSPISVNESCSEENTSKVNKTKRLQNAKSSWSIKTTLSIRNPSDTFGMESFMNSKKDEQQKNIQLEEAEQAIEESKSTSEVKRRYTHRPLNL